MSGGLIFSRMLDTVGDGSGTKDAVGNYSGAATSFKLKPPAGLIAEVGRVIIQIRDTVAPNSDKYGNNITLTNGISVKITRAGEVIRDLTDGLPIKSNAEWGRMCFDIKETGFASGTAFVQARWTFRRFSEKGLILNSGSDDALEFILNDSFVGLVDHYFTAQGVYRDAI